MSLAPVTGNTQALCPSNEVVQESNIMPNTSISFTGLQEYTTYNVTLNPAVPSDQIYIPNNNLLFTTLSDGKEVKWTNYS